MSKSAAALLTAARALLAEIGAAGAEIDRNRCLPSELVRKIVEAGLFRMLVPAELEGAETDLATFAQVIELLATADASTAWCVCQGAGSVLLGAHMDRQGAAEIFGDPETIVARGPGSGTAAAVDGGYRVTGRWSFASGCRHATWLSGVAAVTDAAGHAPGDWHSRERVPGRHAAASPVMLTVFVPAQQAEIIDSWDVSGLRGTGSDTFAVADVFVPARHTLGIPHPQAGTRRWAAGPLYAFSPNSAYASGFASVALGLARATLDAFAELAGGKTQRGARSVLREQPVVQSQVARAEATVRSARAFLHQQIGAAWDAACHLPPGSGPVPLEARALLRLAATHAIHAGAQAVDTAYQAAGATAIFAGNPFERRFRDVHAVTQQIQGSPLHFETVGRFLLGLEPDQTFL